MKIRNPRHHLFSRERINFSFLTNDLRMTSSENFFLRIESTDTYALITYFRRAQFFLKVCKDRLLPIRLECITHQTVTDTSQWVKKICSTWRMISRTRWRILATIRSGKCQHIFFLHWVKLKKLGDKETVSVSVEIQ